MAVLVLALEVIVLRRDAPGCGATGKSVCQYRCAHTRTAATCTHAQSCVQLCSMQYTRPHWSNHKRQERQPEAGTSKGRCTPVPELRPRQRQVHLKGRCTPVPELRPRQRQADIASTARTLSGNSSQPNPSKLSLVYVRTPVSASRSSCSGQKGLPSLWYPLLLNI